MPKNKQKNTKNTQNNTTQEETVEIQPQAETKSEDQTANTPENAQDDSQKEISPEEQIAALEAELKESQTAVLRAFAESENVRKRFERERANLVKYQNERLAKDLLNAVDNLRRAGEAIPEEKKEDLAQFIEGLELTEKELLSAFKKHNITEINAKGQPFDPNLHQAMFELPSTEETPGTVLQVIQAGYTLHDRLLRPAMVGVSKKA